MRLQFAYASLIDKGEQNIGTKEIPYLEAKVCISRAGKQTKRRKSTSKLQKIERKYKFSEEIDFLIMKK